MEGRREGSRPELGRDGRVESGGRRRGGSRPGNRLPRVANARPRYGQADRTGRREGEGSRPRLLTLLLGAPGARAPPPESRVMVDVERSIPQRRPAAGPQ